MLVCFTQGQADRMAFHIENVRSSLLESQGCQDPCTSALTASFSTSTDQLASGVVVFTNNSTNTTSASWEIDGTPFASTTDASFTFNQEGVFENLPHCRQRRLSIRINFARK
ncbi:MAG: hypothetical protein R2788_12760 [Saprospiraceae bacterium]